MFCVRVPATSANLGPAFDCAGIALNLYNSFSFKEIEGKTEFVGMFPEFLNEENLILKSYNRFFERKGEIPVSVRVVVKTEIPPSRGLGSSASCILGGILGANTISHSKCSTTELLEMAAEIEGHPDNIAPALLGGFCISMKEKDKIWSIKLKFSEKIVFNAFIPDFSLSTKKAREILPKEIPFKTAVENQCRAIFLIRALESGDFSFLKSALQDCLHQPYRKQLIPDFDKITKIITDCGGLGFYLSGAGPTIMGLSKNEDKTFLPLCRKKLASLTEKWQILPLDYSEKGAIIEPEEEY